MSSAAQQLAASPEPQTRDRICAVAAGLFADSGFTGVSMRDIADGVGIKAASLYNHFTDKEQLYFAALENAFAERIASIDVGMATEGSPEDRLRATVVALARVSAENSVSRKLVHRELMDGDSARLEQLTRSLFKDLYDRMQQLFAELSPDGSAGITTAFVNALITGYFLLSPVIRLIDPDLPQDPETVGNQVADMLISNLEAGAV